MLHFYPGEILKNHTLHFHNILNSVALIWWRFFFILFFLMRVYTTWITQFFRFRTFAIVPNFNQIFYMSECQMWHFRFIDFKLPNTKFDRKPVCVDIYLRINITYYDLQHENNYNCVSTINVPFTLLKLPVTVKDV